MTKHLRIAVLAIHSSPVGLLGTKDTGGMSVYVRETARWLARRGHTIDIFTCAKGRPDEIQLYPDVRLIHLDGRRFAQIPKARLPLYRQEIFGSLEHYRSGKGKTYDLIYSHYWISGMIGAMAAPRWRCPHVTMFHTLGAAKNNTASGENEPSVRMASERRLAGLVDAVVVPSQREKTHLVNDYQADPTRIHVIPCGVNLDRFHPEDRMRSRVRLGLDTQADILIYVGRFAPLKGLDVLVGAMAHLKESMLRLHLLVVGGDGPEAPSTRGLQAQIRQLNLQSHISLVGRIEQSELPYYYSAADLLVLPSHYESFGLVVLEALACGTVVLATPVGAMESIIVTGLNGTIVQGPESATVARGIAGLLATDRNQRPGQEKIRATVRTCGWASVAERLEAVFQAAGRPPLVNPPF
jgi:D-inositol-3-phosphate glycosyltransferase